MLLKNNTGKIIGIGMESILPGEIKQCPKGYENNPMVQQYIKNKTFEVIQEAEKEPNPKDNKKLEDMSEDELIKYAVEHGIDLGKATTKEGILKKIQEA